MNRNQTYLVRLLASAILQTETPLPSGDIDWEWLLRKCAEQNIAGLAASAVLRLPDEHKPHNFPDWFGSYIETLQMMTRRNAAFDRMLALFHANNIDPVCVKGSVLRKLYPDEALRTMGDYDIWIKPDELSKLQALLSAQGYVITERPLLQEAEKEDIRFEIFTSLEQEFEQDAARWLTWFWENTCREDHGTLVLNPNAELLYTVTHAAKHYVRKGCGVRALLDIVLILKQKGTQIDFDIVRDACKAVGVDSIFLYFLSAAKLYFEMDTPISEAIPNTELFVEYMFEYGIFGIDHRANPFVQATRNGQTDHAIRKLFPSYEVMRNGYPLLQKSKLLLPVAWVCRGYKGVFVKRKTPAKIVADMKASEDFNKIRMTYLKELGLWNE